MMILLCATEFGEPAGWGGLIYSAFWMYGGRRYGIPLSLSKDEIEDRNHIL